MGIIVTAPEQICFSKNRIVWQFEDDKDGVVPGLRAENWLTIGGSVIAGTQAVFRWGDNELRFTASDAPDSTLAQFPTWTYTLDGMQAYVESLVPYFQSNYFIDEEFDVSADAQTIDGPLGSVTLWYVKFLAKKPGSWYNFSKTSFNNGGVANWILGTDDSTVVNNSVFVEVWIGDQESINFKRIHKAVLQFDENSQVLVDVAEILHSQLASELPDFFGSVAMKCRDSRRQYYLRYAQAGGQQLMIGRLQSTAQMVVVLGGFGEWSSEDQSVASRFRESVLGVDKLLLLRGRTRVIRRDEPVFVSWINFSDTPRNVHASAKITFADGTSETTNTNVVTSVGLHEKLMFGVGFSQLNLGFYNGVKDIREYTIQLRDDLGPVSEEYRLIVDYGYREFIRYFAFVNSWGAIETVHTYGKSSNEWKIFKEQSERFLPYVYTQAESQFVEWNHQYQDNGEVASGWIPKKALSVFLDLFISPIKYRIIKGLPYPVAINSDSISKGTDGDNLHGVTFEYQFQRRFESLSEEELEGEEYGDYIPENVVLAGISNLLPLSSGGSSVGGTGATVRVDPYPIPGSNNAISSNAIFVLLQQKQDKLPLGPSTHYYRADGKLMDLRVAVNALESDPTVPAYAKTITSVAKLVNDLQALPVESGLNVQLFGGQVAEWYLRRMTHPSFNPVPPIVVEKGVPFEKYIDLSVYKNSYHSNEDLTVEISFKSDKLSGVAITAEGLQITLKGTLDELMSARDNVLLIIRDANKNQTSVSLKIQNVDEPQGPDPDNRPVCQKGPFHYPPTAIEVFDNSHFRAPFDAGGVNPVAWVIALTQSASNPLRQGQAPPYNGTAYIDVTMESPVAGGTYWLGIAGVLCKSPWDWREITFPDTSTMSWSEGYPKYNSLESYTEFLAKVTTSGRYRTQLLNITANTTEYNEEHDYVADVTEIQVWKPGGYADGKYRLIVGTISHDFTVGAPPVPTKVFKLVGGWDGSSVADLNADVYEGPVPNNGFNGYFEDPDTGVAYRLRRLILEKRVAGNWVLVANVGTSAVAAAPSTVVPASRLIPTPGVDSRSIEFQGVSLNRFGEFRFSVFLHSGATQDTSVVKSYQQTFKLHAFEIKGTTITDLGGVPNRYCPLIKKVLYDGQNVVNDNVWAPPFSGFNPRLEYSVDGGNTWFNDVSSTPDSWGGDGSYSNVWILNNNPIDNFPKGTTRQVIFRNPALPSVRSAPYPVPNSPGSSDVSPAVLGTYETTVSGRKFTYTKSPNFRLSFNNDGSFSDVTPGLQAGTPNKLDGRTVFYMINYSYFASNGDGTSIYAALQNVFLPDGVHTIRHFSCDASKIGNLDAFKAGISGYGSNAVNVYNARLSEITVTIRSSSNPQIPAWLITSRRLNFGQGAKAKSIRNDKIFAMGCLNMGDAHSIYHAKGSHTRMLDDSSIDQPYSYRTFKWDWDGLPIITDEQLYAKFRSFIDNYGLTKDTIITDEIPENTQGTDPSIKGRMKIAYQGALDKLRETTPGLDKKDTNLYGSYGADSVPDRFFFGSKAQVAQSLNEYVHHDWDPATSSWGGISDYYASGHIDVRNVQVSYYMYNGFQGGQRMIPLELVYANERWKIGTKTYDGQDRESKWAVYTTILCQTLVRNELGQQIGVEEGRTGDIIPFPNGEVLSVYNTPSAAVAGEYYELGFWSTLIGNGIMIWGEDTFGLDASKIRTYEPANQPIFWTKNGGSREDWVSGQNGAPVNDPSGVYDLLYATIVDNAHLGYEDARGILDYADALYFASYTSSRKNFTPAPGSSGLHLNGFGAINMGSLSFVDVRDQKAGLAIVGVGSAGKVGVYYNGYLSAQEFEDNVTITHQGTSVNLGRVYGRQTKFIIFPS